MTPNGNWGAPPQGQSMSWGGGQQPAPAGPGGQRVPWGGPRPNMGQTFGGGGSMPPPGGQGLAMGDPNAPPPMPGMGNNAPPPQMSPQGAPMQSSGMTQTPGGFGGMPQGGGAMPMGQGGGQGGLLPHQEMMQRLRNRNAPVQGGGVVPPGPAATMGQPTASY